MPNMSYCRFQNTLGDLADCQEALEELFEGTKHLSESELRHAKALVQSCFDIIRVVGESKGLDVASDEDSEFVENSLEEIFNEANEVAAEDAENEI